VLLYLFVYKCWTWFEMRRCFITIDFQLCLRMGIWRVQVNQVCLILNGTYKLLVYADDVNTLDGSTHSIKKNAEALSQIQTYHAVPLPLPCHDPAILQMWAGRPHAVSGWLMLIHTYHAISMSFPCRAVLWPWEVAFRMAYSWHGRGMAWHVWIKHSHTV
jgi:hypothetical protein